MFPVVDVRDVALAHLRAIKVKEAANHRFLLTNKSLWFLDFARILRKNFPKGYKIPSSDLKYCTMKMASWFDPGAKSLLTQWGSYYEMDNS